MRSAASTAGEVTLRLPTRQPFAGDESLAFLGAHAIATGTVALDASSDPHVARDQLLALKGIGPWTADYVMMRSLG